MRVPFACLFAVGAIACGLTRETDGIASTGGGPAAAPAPLATNSEAPVVEAIADAANAPALASPPCGCAPDDLLCAMRCASSSRPREPGDTERTSVPPPDAAPSIPSVDDSSHLTPLERVRALLERRRQAPSAAAGSRDPADASVDAESSAVKCFCEPADLLCAMKCASGPPHDAARGAFDATTD